MLLKVITLNRDCPLLILDKKGVLISVALPPIQDDSMNKALRLDLERLTNVGIACPYSKRGSFTILEQGIQFGGGSKLPGPKNCSGKPLEECMRKVALNFFNKPYVRTFCDRAAGMLIISYTLCILITADVFQEYFPNLFEYYENSLEATCSLVPDCGHPA